MLKTKTVRIKWNAKIKKHYVDLGYVFTKMKDEFEVFVDDLTNGSSADVKLICDYCGREYTKPWHRYVKERDDSYIKKDCCEKCRKHKIQETTQAKYGVSSVFSVPEIQDKIARTNIRKYGVENPFSSEAIKSKISKTNLEKYGVSCPTKLKSIKEKIKKTCQEKYGVDYYVQTQHFFGEENPRWKGGVEHHRQERSTLDYLNWRRSVYNRDLYTCQKCGAKNHKGNKKAIKLNAHHIYNWADYPDKRYDVDNGITFCDECHKKFHSLYGKRSNTMQQVMDFLNNQGKKVC